MTSKRWLAVLLLIVFGAVRMPFEQRIEAGLKAAHFREGVTVPDDSMREQLGQLGAAAALGGFRSFLATMFELQATTAYANKDYEKVSKHYHLATQLHPREAGYWEMAGWMMGFNAVAYYLGEETEGKYSTAMRVNLARKSVDEALRFLENGLRYVPNDYGINRNLGNLLVRKKGDFCGAAEAFGRAADSMDGPSLAQRHHVYNLAYCPGREEEAYSKLKALGKFFKGGPNPLPDERIPPAFLFHIRYFEKLFDIPAEDRFKSLLDLGALYEKLRRNFKVGQQYEKRHVLNMQRLEDVLDISKSDRIPFGKKSLRPLQGGAK
jgi:tetratricopeptide (TPR) repeat protein